jgi:hypothetical protein
MLTSKGFRDELVERGNVSFALTADVNVIAIEEILELARHLLVYMMISILIQFIHINRLDKYRLVRVY